MIPKICPQTTKPQVPGNPQMSLARRLLKFRSYFGAVRKALKVLDWGWDPGVS